MQWLQCAEEGCRQEVTYSAPDSVNLKDMKAPSHQLLLSETRERITQLEDAIAQINAVRKGLKENSIEVKSQISAVFGRQLECLRSRELWLQGQVELVEHAKESVLRRQQDRLCQLLGSLSTSLAYSQDEEGMELDKKLRESIEHLDQLDLKPEESSNIGFRADLTGLRQAIRGFGRVDSKGLPMENAFVGPETTSSCLPRTYEDYGEPEHLHLYKTVEELRRDRGQVNKINFCVPRLASEPKNPWLSYSLSDNSLDQLAASGDSDQAAGRNARAGLSRNLPGRYSLKSEHSIQHWLHQIKGQVEAEEDDYEIISQPRTHTVSTSSESIEFVPEVKELKLQTSQQCVFSSSQQSVFSNVQGSPLKDWLNKHPASETKETRTTPKMALEKLQDWEQWLIKKPATAVGKASGCYGGSIMPGSCSDPSTPMVDIESLHTLHCADPTYWSKANSGKEWLSAGEKSTVERFMAENEEKDVDEMEWTAISVSAIQGCRANEPCVTVNDCVCDELCCGPINSNPKEESVSESSNKWLSQSDPSATKSDLTFHSSERSQQEWLNRASTRATSVADDSCDLFPVFQQKSSAQQWLAHSNGSNVKANMSHPAAQSDVQWVKPATGAAQNSVSDDLFPGFKNAHRGEDKQKWVLHQEATSTPPPSQIQETLKHMENILSATPAQWLSGYAPVAKSPKPAPPQSWLRTQTPMMPEPRCQYESDIMNGLEKLSLAWLANKNDKSPEEKSWLSPVHNKYKVSEKVSKELVGKEWLAKSVTEEEDDSQWLLRKESTPSSSPAHAADKLAELFPCFQSKEILGNWLLAQASDLEKA